ncbi:hypothetical protein [uncultured Roseobacter sp.]|uniref:hypothetical protein n=1 Tax=uncultured Roseobacter sp. TaxID=114847 RepID=UPI0026207B6F|nr:hypothetical protein [uncultured Roseobacter sp.]
MTTDAKHELGRARLLLRRRQQQRGIAAIPLIAIVVLMVAEAFLSWRLLTPEILFFAVFPAIVLALPFHLRAVTAEKRYLTVSKHLRASK